MSDHAGQPPADYTGRSVGGGRYQLRDLLGTGGMASVHLAWDTVLERQVAVKTMHSDLGREDAFRERFKREAQSVAKLTHSNIVSVFDTGEDDMDGAPVPYIVMEYVEGQPLRTALDEDIRRHGAMPAERALQITADVLAALDISHEMGLVHRDIKPGNVMITRRGVVKVMDFGIARAMQSGVTAMTQTGMVVGTPQYLSPEQALGRGVDARSDLYSVGIMLFELLTGRLPFDADSPLAIAYAHVQEEPPAPSSVNASVPPAVDAMVARMLKKNPNERFPNAEALRAECLRVAGTLTGAVPQIVPGAHTPGNSGAAVSQAVFPEFGGPSAPTPTPPQSPYAPTPAAPVAGPHGGPGAPGGYGYPQTPAAPQPGASTPPPYVAMGAGTPPPGSAGGGGKGGGARRGISPVAIGLVVGLVLVAGVALAALISNSGGGEEEGTGGQAGDNGGGQGQEVEQDHGGQTTEGGEDDYAEESGSNSGESTEEEEDEPRHKDGDPGKTIAESACVSAREYWDQEEYKDAVAMPDFYDVHIDSVKDCIRAAGWTYDEDLTYKDEVLKGEGMVVEQEPGANDPFDPEKDDIVLTVSTGDEPSD